MGKNKFFKGLRLKSNPYPVILVEELERDLRVVLKDETTSLAIFVETEKAEIDQKRVLYLREEPLYDLVKPKNNGYASNLLELIKTRRLENAIKSSIYFNLHSGLNPKVERLDPTQEDAQGCFYSKLLCCAQERLYWDSLPKTIRERSKELINQFPAVLKEKGFMERKELREWANNARYSPIVATLANRILR